MARSSANLFTVVGLQLIAIAGLAGAPRASLAATRLVTSCLDHGVGSLREAVGIAVAGDTVDLRQLDCHRILLTRGPVLIPQSSLVLLGPGHKGLTISGNYTSSVFRHSGTGRLTLRGVTIEQGQHKADNAEGGCVYSAGDIDANDITVRHCGAYAKFAALGGGMYAEGNITLFYSAVYSNGTSGAGTSGGGIASGKVLAGGVYKGGHVRAHRTRFLGNVSGTGGAIRSLDGLTMTYSTVANNRARSSGGGLDVLSVKGGEIYIANSSVSGNSAPNSGAFNRLAANAVIVDSTISGNSADFISVGPVSSGATIANSTIAFNHMSSPFACIAAVVIDGQVHVESSILARNTCNDAPSWDIGNNLAQTPASVVGADNLIQSSVLTSVPADTLTADPMLGVLFDNGGRTLTHLPASGSPVINRGNNVLGLSFDQRGDGFPRVKGTRADIGAVER